ncbi:MAG: cellulase family glycosylhydrolase [Anaerolineales bacterium]|nr:cellulase family glycosylhydrolase [Anaerolineales bacterium]
MMRISGNELLDGRGRTLLLRGVNLGGSSKVPFRPDGATHIRENFFGHRGVSFVGRPFPLEEADEHLGRLRAWGFNFLRFLVTWEAVEHAGPGIYDEEYLEYVRAVVEKAGRHGFLLFIDPHQDVWSRFSGGDGAPGWTLEAAGFDLRNLHATGAAVLHPFHEGPLPRMIWPTNEAKLAAGTMFTLFFGGNVFAPRLRVEGEPIQDFLQRRYLGAVCRLAERLKDLPCVVGYDTLNEPGKGFLGWEDLRRPGGYVKVGPLPSPFQSMLLGSGFSQAVEVWEAGPTGFRRTGSRILNEGRRSAWLPGRECPWRGHGVWDVGADGRPRCLAPEYFAARNGRRVDFSQDYYLPFARRFAEAVRAVDPKAVVFIESSPETPPPEWKAGNIVYAPHWYDGSVLFFRNFSAWLATNAHTGRPIFTPWYIRRSFREQLELFRCWAEQRLDSPPVLIGESGIAYDLQDKRAYRTGDFRQQARAMDRLMRAFEDARLSLTLWNYTADNTNAHGDGWNNEDLSIFSRDQQSDPRDVNSGGRALGAVVRPYVRAAAGELLRMSFDVRRRTFSCAFRHAADVIGPTEVFVPRFHYPDGADVSVSDGTYEYRWEEQVLLYRHTAARETHTIRIRPRR